MAKVVLVTGCSSGLGEALVKALCAQRRPDASPRYKVYASARRIEHLSALEAAGINTVALDVTSESSVQEAIACILQQEKRIDVLVNNAGLGRFGPIAEQPLDEVDQMLDTNVMGVIRVTQAVVPSMAGVGQGLIVNIGSVSAWLSTPFSGGYCASKAALHAFSDSLRLELRPFNISVTTVCAGAIKTSFSDNAMSSSGVDRYENPDSLYQKFVPYIRQRITMSQTAKSVKTAEAVAKQIVHRINRADRGSKLVVPSSFLAAGNAFFSFNLGLFQKLFGKTTDNLLARPFGL